MKEDTTKEVELYRTQVAKLTTKCANYKYRADTLEEQLHTGVFFFSLCDSKLSVETTDQEEQRKVTQDSLTNLRGKVLQQLMVLGNRTNALQNSLLERKVQWSFQYFTLRILKWNMLWLYGHMVA